MKRPLFHYFKIYDSLTPVTRLKVADIFWRQFIPLNMKYKIGVKEKEKEKEKEKKKKKETIRKRKKKREKKEKRKKKKIGITWVAQTPPVLFF